MWPVWTAGRYSPGASSWRTPQCAGFTLQPYQVRGAGGSLAYEAKFPQTLTSCSLFSFVRNCQTVLQSGRPVSHCHLYPAAPCLRQHLLGMVLRVLAVLTNVWLCVLLFTSPFPWGHASLAGTSLSHVGLRCLFLLEVASGSPASLTCTLFASVSVGVSRVSHVGRCRGLPRLTCALFTSASVRVSCVSPVRRIRVGRARGLLRLSHALCSRVRVFWSSRRENLQTCRQFQETKSCCR